MTTTTTTDQTSTRLPHEPVRVEIEPLHLSITGVYDSGVGHNVHLVENGDLGVMLDSASTAHPGADVPPHKVEDTGVVAVSLGVDGDHDEVHYVHRNIVTTEELLTQAIESLMMCRDAVRRVTRL